jgi:hypothetical protein
MGADRWLCRRDSLSAARARPLVLLLLPIHARHSTPYKHSSTGPRFLLPTARHLPPSRRATADWQPPWRISTTARAVSIQTRSAPTSASFSACRPRRPIHFHPGLPPLRLDYHPLRRGWPGQASLFGQEACEKRPPRPASHLKLPAHHNQS